VPVNIGNVPGGGEKERINKTIVLGIIFRFICLKSSYFHQGKQHGVKIIRHLVQKIKQLSLDQQPADLQA